MLTAFLEYYARMGWIEWTGLLVGIVCVYYCVRQNMMAWFTGLIAVICWGYLFWGWKLYTDAMLQIIYYIPITFWGWWYWAQRSNNMGWFRKWFWSRYDEGTVHRIRTLTWSSRLGIAIVIMAVAASWGYVMETFTDAALPTLDALTVSMSIVAMFLMSKRFLENWVIWIAMDLISLYKYTMVDGLGATTLYLIYTCLATAGLVQWWKIWKGENSHASN